MMRALVFIVAFVIGVVSIPSWVTDDSVSVLRLNSVPKFKYMGGNTFLSPGGKLQYAHDCIGCDPIGDINIYHNTERKPENTRYTLEANCGAKANGDVKERGEKLDEQGERIGSICIVTMGNEPRIFWTEGEEYWIIGAPTLQALREFESSEDFRSWRHYHDGR